MEITKADYFSSSPADKRTANRRECWTVNLRYFSDRMHTLDARVIYKDRDANIASWQRKRRSQVRQDVENKQNSISLIKVSNKQFKIPHRTHFSRALFYFNLTVFAFGLQSNVLIYYFAFYTFACFSHFTLESQFEAQLKWTSVANASWKRTAARNKIELNLHMKLNNNGKEFAVNETMCSRR